MPALPGADLGIDSDGFFALDRMPASVALVGSGYIAAELSGVLAALGAQVTVLIRRDRMLRNFDEMLSLALMKAMREDGIRIVEHATPAAVTSHADGRRIELADGRIEGPFESLIWAVGREARSDGLGLEAAGVATGADGEITTDLYQDTNVPGIHAIGDVTGREALTPVAIAAGRRLADRLFGGMGDRHLDYRLIPTVVFTHPPIGTVGLTEQEARERHGDTVEIFALGFHAALPRHDRAQAPRRDEARDRRCGSAASSACTSIGMGRRRDAAGLRRSAAAGRDQARFRRHGRDPSHQRGRIRDDALT